MSIYSVHKICWLVHHDGGFRERVRQDPAGTIADERLTDEERKALLSGDVSRLALLGGHGYMLGLLSRHRVFGLDRDVYVQRMRDAKELTSARARDADPDRAT